MGQLKATGAMKSISGMGAADRRLDSWKEIAQFFDRDESTVKRWEKKSGLPIHRMPGARGSVYAFTSELSAWLADPGNPVSPQETAPSEPSASSGAATTPVVLPARRKKVNFIFALGLLLLIATAVLLLAQRSNKKPPSAVSATPASRAAAQDLYLQGVFYWRKRTPDSLNKAVDYFTQAIVRDPNYAEAYVGLADCYNLLREYSLMPAEEAFPRAKAAAERAIQLDEKLPGAHTALAFVNAYWSWDTAGAEREFKRALQIDPGSVQAHHWYANFLDCLQRSPEALEQIEAARALDPGSPAILADKGVVLFYSGDEAAAINLLRQVEAAEPDFLSPHTYLAFMYRARGEDQKYLGEAAIAARLLRDERQTAILEAGQRSLARGGRAAMLDTMLRLNQSQYANGQEPAFLIAQLYALAGKKTEAFQYLRIACARRDTGMTALLIDPAYKSLREEPEFKKLLQAAGLPANSAAAHAKLAKN